MRRTLVATFLLLSIAVLAVGGVGSFKTTQSPGGLHDLGLSPLGSRILVVAPHPDDEGLATGGLIHQALAEHRQVKVVIMTCGDGARGAVRAHWKRRDITSADYLAMGRERIKESISATARLGLPPSDLIFLAYPDGGLNSLWDVNWDYSNLHRGLNGADHSPYGFAYQKRAPYCGENIVKNLMSIVKDYKPTSILYPDTEDDHHDHWAANAFTQYALIKSAYKGREYTYLVHRKDFPVPGGYFPNDDLRPAAALKGLETTWDSLPLSARDEQLKEQALAMYKMARLVRAGFIEGFVRKNELVGTVEERSVSRVQGAPPLGSPTMPWVVEYDPPGDCFRGSSAGGGDMRTVSFCVGNREAYFGVGTVGRVASALTYAFRLRIFDGSRVERVDVNVRNGAAWYVRLARNSLVLHGAIAVREFARRLWIELPASLFTRKETVMMSVDCLAGPHKVDRTSWRSYTI